MINIDAQVLTEVREILNFSSMEVQKKIPYRFRKYVVKNYDRKYKTNIDKNKKLWEQDVKTDTKKLLDLIYRDYLEGKDIQ